MKPIVLGITGASGAVYARRLLQALLASGRETHLTISDSGRQLLEHELGLSIDLDRFRLSDLLPDAADQEDRVHYHHFRDFMSPIAGGSFPTQAMVICPCSGGTLSGVATGRSGNLIQRAAEVHLKERRPLILVTRETPLSLIQIENMQRACLAGATLLPASPGFYLEPKSLDDLIDFIVARILDQLDIEHPWAPRWGTPQESGDA